ncbi:MAG: KEOPS complex kinase/ATPase Bud32, partial [Candidatus Aenigmatarchaeota archaeon]
ARLLSEARRAGVPTPAILEVDEKNFKIVMSFIDGVRLKELINEGCDLREIGTEVGNDIGKLHAAGIVHGDLTTSNMIQKGAELFFIDFGLGFFSNRPEDQAVDLAVLREAIRSTHFRHSNALWGYIVQGYKDAFGGAEKVLKSLDNIEKRGRYVRRDD